MTTNNIHEPQESYKSYSRKKNSIL